MNGRIKSWASSEMSYWFQPALSASQAKTLEPSRRSLPRIPSWPIFYLPFLRPQVNSKLSHSLHRHWVILHFPLKHPACICITLSSLLSSTVSQFKWMMTAVSRTQQISLIQQLKGDTHKRIPFPCHYPHIPDVSITFLSCKLQNHPPLD